MARIASAKSRATDLTWILSMRLRAGSGMVSVTTSWRSGEASMRSIALPGVDDTGFHRDRAPLEHEARRLHQGATARHLVIDDEGDLSLDVADQIHRVRDLVVP